MAFWELMRLLLCLRRRGGGDSSEGLQNCNGTQHSILAATRHRHSQVREWHNGLMVMHFQRTGLTLMISKALTNSDKPSGAALTWMNVHCPRWLCMGSAGRKLGWGGGGGTFQPIFQPPPPPPWAPESAV